MDRATNPASPMSTAKSTSPSTAKRKPTTSEVNPANSTRDGHAAPAAAQTDAGWNASERFGKPNAKSSDIDSKANNKKNKREIVKFISDFMDALSSTASRAAAAAAATQQPTINYYQARNERQARKRLINRQSAQKKRERDKEELASLARRYAELGQLNEQLRTENDGLRKIIQEFEEAEQRLHQAHESLTTGHENLPQQQQQQQQQLYPPPLSASSGAIETGPPTQNLATFQRLMQELLEMERLRHALLTAKLDALLVQHQDQVQPTTGKSQLAVHASNQPQAQQQAQAQPLPPPPAQQLPQATSQVWQGPPNAPTPLASQAISLVEGLFPTTYSSRGSVAFMPAPHSCGGAIAAAAAANEKPNNPPIDVNLSHPTAPRAPAPLFLSPIDTTAIQQNFPRPEVNDMHQASKDFHNPANKNQGSSSIPPSIQNIQVSSAAISQPPRTIIQPVQNHHVGPADSNTNNSNGLLVALMLMAAAAATANGTEPPALNMLQQLLQQQSSTTKGNNNAGT